MCDVSTLSQASQLQQEFVVYWIDLQVNKSGALRWVTDGRNGGCLSASLRYTARPSAGSPGH